VRRRDPCRTWLPPSLSPSSPGYQSRQLIAHFQSPTVFPFPLPSLCPNDPPAIYGKPPAAVPSHFPSPLLLSLFKLDLELTPSPLNSHRTHTRSSTPFSIAAASVPPLLSVEHTSPVKGSSLSSFIFLWSYVWRSLSFSCRRFTSSTPSGAAPLSCRCAARTAAVTDHRRPCSILARERF
jgi:hypothetical protein